MIHKYHMNRFVTNEQLRELWDESRVAERNNDQEALDMLDLIFEKIDLGKILVQDFEQRQIMETLNNMVD
jgi:hypothetical protein